MLILTLFSTFLCIALVVMSIYWLVSRQASVVNSRLNDLDPTLTVTEENPVAAFVERIATPINQLVPVSAVEADKLQKKLMQAGYRSSDAPTTFRAIQMVALVAFPCAVLAACFLLNRPLNNALIWSFVAAAVGFYLPRYILLRKIKGRQQRITWGLADALDLIVISVEAGLGLNAALVRVGQESKGIHPEIYEEFEMVNLEIRVGRARDEALRNLVERTGVDDIRSFVALMIQADRFGSSIGKAVRIFGDSLRTKRRQRAEQASQKAALKLLFPLTLFLFPVILLIVLGPAILNLVDILGK